MAICLRFLSTGRKCSPVFFSEKLLRRSISSSLEKIDQLEETVPSGEPDDDLKSRILRLRFSQRSATNAIRRWIDEGKRVSLPELRQITKHLNRSQRYKHALEVSQWMGSQEELEVSDQDYAIRIDLTSKVLGIDAAEEYFDSLPPSAKTAEAYTALLHSYAKAKLVEKAEDLFKRAKEANVGLNTLAYNEMMTLYISVGQLDKIFLVIDDMKMQQIPPDLFTYNLRVTASAATFDVDNVRRILYEMNHDSSAIDDWSLYSTLIDIYITVGNLVKSENTLIESQEKFSQRDWITYDFLIILYAGLKNKERIDQIWKSMRMAPQKLTRRNYIGILSSYIILGHLKEAGDILDEWIQSSSLSFDVSICYGICESFVHAGLNEKADLLQQLMLQRNLNPNECT